MKPLTEIYNQYGINPATLNARVKKYNLTFFYHRGVKYLSEAQEQQVCYPLYHQKKGVMVIFEKENYLIFESKMNYATDN